MCPKCRSCHITTMTIDRRACAWNWNLNWHILPGYIYFLNCSIIIYLYSYNCYWTKKKAYSFCERDITKLRISNSIMPVLRSCYLFFCTWYWCTCLKRWNKRTTTRHTIRLSLQPTQCSSSTHFTNHDTQITYLHLQLPLVDLITPFSLRAEKSAILPLTVSLQYT